MRPTPPRNPPADQNQKKRVPKQRREVGWLILMWGTLMFAGSPSDVCVVRSLDTAQAGVAIWTVEDSESDHSHDSSFRHAFLGGFALEVGNWMRFPRQSHGIHTIEIFWIHCVAGCSSSFCTTIRIEMVVWRSKRLDTPGEVQCFQGSGGAF